MSRQSMWLTLIFTSIPLFLMRISPYSTPLSHLLLFSMFASQFALTPSSQIEILHDLYLATNGKQWNWKDETIYGPRWSFSLYNTSSQSDPCNSWNNTISWQGITCTYPPSLCQFSSCSIKSINLIDYAMNGTIPDSLYTLSSLEELKFSGNYLLGSVSSLIGSLSNLDTYCVDQNSLTGSLPSTIGLLSNLATLEVHFNSLTGSIPPTLGSLSKLELLYLYRNLLSGPIPSSIGSLSRLTYLIFFSNFITGSLPSSLGSLTNLLYLYSHTNALSGPLPSTLGSLSNVKYILSYSNLLEESIPSSLGSLLELRQLDLSNNRLTGALPSSLALLSNLETLIASTNHFEKEIPSELGVLTQLFYFIFYFNQLTGSIPETFGSLSQLRYLYLFSNRLTGTIPSVLASLRFMTDLSVDGNMLTGSIPSSIAKLKLLEYLAVNDNVLTGFIPPSLGDLSYLQFFLVSSNQLTGTIPTSLGRFSKLMYFYVDSNHLSGSLPSSLNQLNKVITFHCYNNHLHGTLPLKLDSFASIERFFIQRNHFQGTLTTFFTNSSRLSNVPLTNFDISGNLFTGSIPEEIFRIPPLESIALSVNKFQHTIPNSICDAINMKVMSLDGLGAAIEGPFLPFTSITIDRRMKGGIPDCLWRLSRLEELSLAGNGLTGTISKTASMYSLRNLTLSHNYLSGRIPNWIIEKNLTVLDLSNNKLTGELEGLQFFPYNNISSRTLKLRVNRLSGPLPDNLQQYSSLNILAGNIFGCSNIPSNDKKSEWYVCGSSEFDHSIYTLLGIICLIFFGGSLVAISWISLKLTHSLNFFSVTILTSYNLLLKEMSYYIVAKTSSLEFSHSEILKFGRALASIKQMTGFILAGCLICSIPLYVLKSLNSDTTTNEEELEYVTHSHQYRWHWTAAFLSGPLPAGLILMTSFMTLIILVLYEPRLLNVEANSTDIVEDQGSITYSQFAAASPKDSSSSLPIRNSFSPVNGPNIQDKSEKLFQVIYVSLMLLLNIGIVGTANGLYVWSTSQNSSKSIRLLSQLGLSVFKIVWRVCVRFMFLQLKRDSDFRLVIWLSCCLGVLNSVVIPCIATALTNPSCYQVSFTHLDDNSTLDAYY